jgi:succinyl-CoA synthetase alpha subunit
MGYVAGNPSLAESWKTYMDQQGNFYLKGSGTNKLEWNGSDLTINGTVNATSGSFSGDISGASGTFTGELSCATATIGSGSETIVASGGNLTISGDVIATGNIKANNITESVFLSGAITGNLGYTDTNILNATAFTSATGTLLLTVVVNMGVGYHYVGLYANGVRLGNELATNNGGPNNVTIAREINLVNQNATITVKARNRSGYTAYSYAYTAEAICTLLKR